MIDSKMSGKWELTNGILHAFSTQSPLHTFPPIMTVRGTKSMFGFAFNPVFQDSKTQDSKHVSRVLKMENHSTIQKQFKDQHSTAQHSLSLFLKTKIS